MINVELHYFIYYYFVVTLPHVQHSRQSKIGFKKNFYTNMK